MNFFGGNKMIVQKILILIVFASLVVNAQISDATRNDKAVVHYDFQDSFSDTETNVVIPDKANAKFGAALNLKWMATDRSKIEWRADSSNDGYLWIKGSTIVRSINLASKINTECMKSTSTGLTLEAEIENNETVEERTGQFPAANNVTQNLQPLRIMSMSRDFTNRTSGGVTTFNVNFALGQVYEMGDRIVAAVTNNANGNLFTQPVMSSNTAALIVGKGRIANNYKQKIIFTLNKESGFATLYLSDRNGNLYPSRITQTGFAAGDAATYFSRWTNQAYLNVGNDMATTASLTRNESFKTIPPGSSDADNPNRFWKGKVYRLAVYCQALTSPEILGNAYQIVKNQAFPIVNVPRTKNLLRASEIYERLTGAKTPIYNPILTQMEERLNGNDAVGAAALVTENPLFYNITVRNFAGKMSNRDETINFPLNDFTATVIGAVRDNISAKELLYGDFFYMGDSTKAAVSSDDIDDVLRSNNHYDSLDQGNYDLKAVLMKRKQIILKASSTNNNNSTQNNNINNIIFEAIENPWAAGLLTTRQWAAAHLVAGTNRRAVEFSLREFTCTPIENAADSSGPEDPIGRDIDRNPGGSRSKFTTSCRACHTILDGFKPAFAKMTFSSGFMKHSALVPNANTINEDNSIVMGVHPDGPGVARKMNHNEETYINGKILKDEKWVNNAGNGTNKNNFGWGPRVSGQGTAEFGKALAESKAFPRCMAKRVFFTVCKREADTKDDAFIKKVAEEFSSTERNYNLKYLFQRIVANESCLGGN